MSVSCQAWLLHGFWGSKFRSSCLQFTLAQDIFKCFQSILACAARPELPSSPNPTVCLVEDAVNEEKAHCTLGPETMFQAHNVVALLLHTSP